MATTVTAADIRGSKKAALFLISLGVESAIEVTKKMERSSAYDLLRQASKINNLDPDESYLVLQEFTNMLQSSAHMPSGKEFVSTVMEEAFGGDDPLNNIDFLRRLDKPQLLEIVRNEHPQVAAFVLSYISSEQAAVLMSELSPEQQLDVAARIAISEPPQREALSHLARSLGSRLNNFFSGDPTAVEVGGVPALVKIMKTVGREVEQNILNGFAETRPELAEELKKNMFVFDDLSGLDDKALQRVLKEVDGKVLALALKRASQEILDMIRRNMSERARNILMEDLDAAGKVRLKEVDKAQSDIVNAVRRLAESGEIVVSRENEAYV